MAVLLSGCVQPTACTEEAKVCPDGSTVSRNPALNCEFDPCPAVECAGEGEEFSEEKNCCVGLVRAVNTCEKCKEEGEPLAFDGIPCCEGLEAVDGFCRNPGEELPCRQEGETIPVIANPPECCEGLMLIPPKEEMIMGIRGYCTAKCGNGICDEETESAYNCPVDCAENFCRNQDYECTLEAIPCCEGLTEVPLAMLENEQCIAAQCGSICLPCGNNICESQENNCNCPEDCGH